MSKVDLKVDFCGYEAAKFAVEHWHYSRSMPAFKRVTIGAWEDTQYIGAVIFSWGANRNIGMKYNLKQGEIVELVRVALTKHQTPVSRIVSIAIKMLRKQSPGIKMILSYADPMENHHGGIYQAMGWLYTGFSGGSEKVLYRGRWAHKRTVDSMFGNHKDFKTKKVPGKHTYLYPVTNDLRERLQPLTLPYPKRLPASEVTPGDTIGDQPIEGGSRPTRTL